MNIIMSGASGFLGKEIYSLLKDKNDFNVVTIGRSNTNSIICDLSIEKPVIEEKYDILLHVAGKAHSIPKTDKEKEEFYNVNHVGTRNFLVSSKNNLPKTIVFISTVAVYGRDYGEMIDESHPLLGNTPYAKSKILAEEEVIKFSKEHKINYVILRLPLISGANPLGNLGAMMNAIKKGYYFRIGKGEARKSVVSTKDVAKLIINLKDKNGIYNLTDRKHPTFKEIEDHIASLCNKKIIALPKFIFSLLAKIGDFLPFFIINTNKLKKITDSLTFSDKKAVNELGWSPTSAIESITKK